MILQYPPFCKIKHNFARSCTMLQDHPQFCKITHNYCKIIHKLIFRKLDSAQIFPLPALDLYLYAPRSVSVYFFVVLFHFKISRDGSRNQCCKITRNAARSNTILQDHPQCCKIIQNFARSYTIIARSYTIIARSYTIIARSHTTVS